MSWNWKEDKLMNIFSLQVTSPTMSQIFWTKPTTRFTNNYHNRDEEAGVYEIPCSGCDKVCVGETARYLSKSHWA